MLKKILLSTLAAAQLTIPAHAANQAPGFVYRYTKTVILDEGQLEDTKSDFPVIDMQRLVGNANTKTLTSQSVASALASIASQIDGGAANVTIQSISPAISGMSINDKGELQGVPTTEFHDTTRIVYLDGKGNKGILRLAADIYPRPALTSSSQSYSVPVSSDASAYDIAVEPANAGFYEGVTYSLAPSSGALPAGLKLQSDGSITGQITASAGSVASVVIRGTSIADSGIYADRAFTVSVDANSPMKLDVKPNDVLAWTMDDKKTSVMDQELFVPAPTPTGSFKKPLAWSLTSAPDWLNIDENGQLYGLPKDYETYNATVVVTDADGQSASDNVSLKVSASSNLFIEPRNPLVTVRRNETFKTLGRTTANATGAVTYSMSGIYASCCTLDTATGEITGKIAGAFDGTTHIYLSAKDTVGRTDGIANGAATKSTADIKVEGPLTAPRLTRNASGKVGGNLSPISVAFGKPFNAIGDIEYTITGNLPGPLYYRNSGVLTDDYGVVVTSLPSNSFVFDTEALTLVGQPSEAGSWTVAINAHDTHEEDGYKINPTDADRAKYENSSQFVTVTAVDNFYVLKNNSDAETVARDTAQPTIRTTATNNLTGGTWTNLTWNQVSGSLPPGITAKVEGSGSSLDYSGYPTEEGVFGDIVWEVTSANGLSFYTDPVTFTIGARKPLTVNSARTEATVSLGRQTLNQTFNVVNPARGLSGTWSIDGTLPTGVTLGTVPVSFGVPSPFQRRLYGTPKEPGTFDVTLIFKDAAGDTAHKDFRINVLDREPIDLVASTSFERTLRVRDDEANLVITPINLLPGEKLTAADWSVTGTLPDGIKQTISASGVTFSGKATQVGTWDDIVVSATDSSGNLVQKNVKFVVEQATFQMVGIYSSRTFTAQTQNVDLEVMWARNPDGSVHTDNLTYTLESGTFPAGMKMYPDPARPGTVRVQGYAEETGSFTSRWRATADDGYYVISPDMVFYINDRTALGLSGSAPASVQTGQSTTFGPFTPTNVAYGKAIPAEDWTITNVPPGMTPTVTNGVLTIAGTPTATGNYALSITVKDAAGQTATYTADVKTGLSFNAQRNSPINGTAISNDLRYGMVWLTLPNNNNALYSTTDVVWTMESGSFPPGLYLENNPNERNSRFVRGYGEQAGSWTSTWRATAPDGSYAITPPITINLAARNNLSLNGSASASVNAGTALTLGTFTPVNYAFGEAITQDNWTVTGLPTGMNTSVTNGVLTISGTPTVPGTYALSVTARDAAGQTATYTRSVVVNQPFVAKTNTPFTGTALTSDFNRGFVWIVRNGTNTLYDATDVVWTLESGTFPEGLRLENSLTERNSRSIRGYAQQPGTYKSVWRVTSPEGYYALTPEITVTVAPRATFGLSGASSATLTAGNSGVVGTITPSNAANGQGVSADNWSVTNLPPGMGTSIVNGNLYISGTPTTPGTYNMNVHAVDSAGAGADRAVTVTVNSPFRVIIWSQDQQVTSRTYAKNAAFKMDINLVQPGNTSLYTAAEPTWTLNGTLPEGLTFSYSPTNNQVYIRGNTTESGVFVFSYTATDKKTGITATSPTFTLTVNN